MPMDTRELLADDLEVIRETMSAFKAYDFPAFLQKRMEDCNFSANRLGNLIGVKHTTVSSWQRGIEKPNSKERMKALGLALEMDEKELDDFLLKNGYPGLYVKNPYDCVTKMLLQARGARADNLPSYDETIARLQPEAWSISPAAAQGHTLTMSRAFRLAVTEERIDEWFRNNAGSFRGDRTTLHFGREMGEYLRLFIGGSVNDLVSSGRLPAALRNPLYGLLRDNAVSIRSLRENLILLGLHLNMTEEELDRLLTYARLRRITSPETTVDIALLATLRQAHERYAGYELCNAQAMSERLPGLSNRDLRALLQRKLEERLPELEGLMTYYDTHAGTEDREFERRYTPWGDCCIADYVQDVLGILAEEGILAEKEIAPFMQKTRRKDGED